jgi:Alpha-acetolactate decarboxylase
MSTACHHLRSGGTASIAAPDDLTPFAAVTWFKPDLLIHVPVQASRADITRLIDQAITTTNLIQAIRIDGIFSYVKTRTVAAQTPPYPPLTQATATEPITEFRDVAGTLAGYRTPDYEQGISVAGYHLHFINDPKAADQAIVLPNGATPSASRRSAWHACLSTVVAPLLVPALIRRLVVRGRVEEADPMTGGSDGYLGMDRDRHRCGDWDRAGRGGGEETQNR